MNRLRSPFTMLRSARTGKMAPVLTGLIALLLLVLLIKPVQAQTTEGQYDLAVSAIEAAPANPRAGQETSFVISYENRGAGTTPDDIDVSALMTVTAEESNELVEECAEPVTGAAGLAPGVTNTFTFQSCNVVFRAAGNHTVRAALVSTSQVAQVPREGDFASLLDDVEDSNNGMNATVAVVPYESALPEQLGQLLAGLGMFFAVMAIVAVGTEVVVESVKMSLGLKSKMKSLDALAQMEKYIPGTLATLGVTSEAQGRFRQLTATMQQTVTPVSEIPTLIDNVKRGDLVASIAILEKFGLERERIQQLLDEVNEVQNAAISAADDWRIELELLFTTLDHGLDRLKRSSLLREEQLAFLREIEGTLARSREKLASLQLDIIPEDIDDLDDLPANVREAALVIRSLIGDWQILIPLLTHQVQRWSAQATADWLFDKRDELLSLGREEALARFDQELVPQLAAVDDFLNLFGADNLALVEETRRRLGEALDLAQNETVAATDVYLHSISNLLEAVEERRNLMQSPARKIWRRLRQSPHGLIWLALGIGAVVLIVEAVFNLTIVGHALLRVYDLEPFMIQLGGALIDGILIAISTALLLAALGWLGKTVYTRLHNGRNPTKRSGPVTALDKVEILWNWLRGDTMEPDEFGAPADKNRKVRNLSPYNLAQIVFERTDQQGDEEGSRLRALRVISVMIGLALAYLLQIDAAELLDAAVPGIEATINRVLFVSGERLHAWQPLFSSERALTAGIILTGFAASAGSAFWHDRLDQLQASKRAAESVARSLQLMEGPNQDADL